MSKRRAEPVYLARNSSLFTILELAESLGASRDDILDEIRLDPASLDGIGAKVPAHMIVDAIECAAAMTRRKDFGLLLGKLHDHRFIGPLGLLFEQAETFAEAWAMELRFFHLHNNSIKNTSVRQGSRTLLRTVVLDKGMFEPCHYFEAAAVLRVHIVRMFLGRRWLPSLVMFRHKQLSPMSKYERLLGPNVRFEQAMDAFAFTAAELNRKTNPREPEVKRKLEAMLKELDAERAADIASRVSRLLRMLLPLQRGTIEEVAKAMAMTPRTLQRRLDARSVSFRDILADVRFEMAREYLGGGLLTTAQVAPLLGLSESSALSRFLRDHADVSARDLRSGTGEKSS